VTLCKVPQNVAGKTGIGNLRVDFKLFVLSFQVLQEGAAVEGNVTFKNHLNFMSYS
jgi:hypothetical protein